MTRVYHQDVAEALIAVEEAEGWAVRQLMMVGYGGRMFVVFERAWPRTESES